MEKSRRIQKGRWAIASIYINYFKKPNKRVKLARKNHELGFGDKTRLTPYPSR